MKIKNLRSWGTERLSQRLLYVLVGLAAVVFLLFFLVGYDMPFDENPDFNAPLFTDLLLGLMVLVFVLAVALVMWVSWRSYRQHAHQDAVVNGVPARKISRIIWISTFCLLIVAFALGSSAPMLVNGDEYADWLWLKVSDMFVWTSVVMLVAAVGVVIFGVTRYVRKERRP